MHSKMIFVRKTKGGNGKYREPPGWAYVGSANLSESAWLVNGNPSYTESKADNFVTV
jgi:HKD family nuclease